MPKAPSRSAPKKGPDWAGAKAWPLDAIKPYGNNPRTHPDEQIDVLAGLLRKYGADQPIVVDESGVILKGHGRLLAARQAGLEEFPVVQRFGLSDADKIALRISDNQVALLSGWDDALMKYELKQLDTAGFDTSLIGFSARDLEQWTAPPPPSPEEIPPAPAKPIVRLGDRWDLGDHRLVVGDSTKAETWAALFRPGEKASLGFTDPPYGVSYEAEGFQIIKGDDKRRDALFQMLVQSLRQMTKRIDNDAAVYIWHASSTREDFAQAMKAVGLVERQYLIWVKPTFVFGRADYQWQHEPCFYASKGEQAPAFYGERSESTVWHVQVAEQQEVYTTIGNGVVLLDGEGGEIYIQARPPKAKKPRQIRLAPKTAVHLSGAELVNTTVWQVARDADYEHPTQKPVELARRAIENSSRPGEIVTDCFMGSGTLLLAAEMTGRRCFGIELDEKYGQVIIERWERFTGRHATLAGTDQTYTQVAKARRRPAPGKPAQRQKRRGAAEPPPSAETAP
jgi:DNA modification methylase